MFLTAACGGSSGGGAAGSGGEAGTSGAAGTGGGAAGTTGAAGTSGGAAGTTGAVGTTSVTYKGADGVSHTFAGKAVARIENTTSDADLMIWIYSVGGDACGYPKLALGQPWMELEVLRYATNPAAIGAGTYSFALVDENPGSVRGMAYLRHYETGCNQQSILRNSSDGLPGSITVTAISATEVVGTFEFDGKARPTGQGHASGSFRATVCGTNVGTMCQP
jgi:hypothetical protein